MSEGARGGETNLWTIIDRSSPIRLSENKARFDFAPLLRARRKVKRFKHFVLSPEAVPFGESRSKLNRVSK